MQAKAASCLLSCPETLPARDSPGKTERQPAGICSGRAAVEAAGAAAAQEVSADLQQHWRAGVCSVLPSDPTASDSDTAHHGESCARGAYSLAPPGLAVFPCAIFQPGWMSQIFMGRLILSLAIISIFIFPCLRILVGLPASSLITPCWKGNRTVLDCDSFFCFVNSELVGVVSQRVIAHW